MKKFLLSMPIILLVGVVFADQDTNFVSDFSIQNNGITPDIRVCADYDGVGGKNNCTDWAENISGNLFTDPYSTDHATLEPGIEVEETGDVYNFTLTDSCASGIYALHGESDEGEYFAKITNPHNPTYVFNANVNITKSSGTYSVTISNCAGG